LVTVTVIEPSGLGVTTILPLPPPPPGLPPTLGVAGLFTGGFAGGFAGGFFGNGCPVVLSLAEALLLFFVSIFTVVSVFGRFTVISPVFGLAVIVVPSGSVTELEELDVELFWAETPLAVTSSNAATTARNRFRYRLRMRVVSRNDLDTLRQSPAAGAYANRAHALVLAANRNSASIDSSSHG
jgi:hypothetical protein